MVNDVTGTTLRDRRHAAGLSQRELARRSGVAQPNIAAYESGRRTPAPTTLARLDAAMLVPSLERVRHMRAALLAAAARRDLSDVRVFGSVARGGSGAHSDLDLLVTPGPGASVFDLAGFMVDARELVGVDVDVVSDRGTGATMERIRAEAVPL